MLLNASEETYSATLSDAAVAPPRVAELRDEDERSKSAHLHRRSTPGDVSHSAVRLVQSDHTHVPFDPNDPESTMTNGTYDTAQSKTADDVTSAMTLTVETEMTMAYEEEIVPKSAPVKATYEYFSPKRSERDVTATPSDGTISGGGGAIVRISNTFR